MTRSSVSHGVAGLIVLTGVLAQPAARVDGAELPCDVHEIAIHSGMHAAAYRGEARRAFSEIVGHPNVTWVRLHFEAFDLGAQSFLKMTSLQDGAEQLMSARDLDNWYQWSAFFNGDAVKLELYVGPGDEDVFIQVDQIAIGGPAPVAPTPEGTGDRSLCVLGVDGRTVSADPAVGRLENGTTGAANCTVYIASNGALFTAGHCVPLIATGFTLAAFNVPLSANNGQVNLSAPQDQYPIDNPSIQCGTCCTSGCCSSGNDWAVFQCNPNVSDDTQTNPNFNQTPAIGQDAFYRLSSGDLGTLDIVQVTGCGIDSLPRGTGGSPFYNTWSQTLQTDSGLYFATFGNMMRYALDTEPANSGSPVINTENMTAQGIHVCGGCAIIGYNQGTAFTNTNLRGWIRQVPAYISGSNVWYVDNDHPATTVAGRTPDGTPFLPDVTLEDGIDRVVASTDTVLIVKGTYPEILTIGDDGKAMTLIAPVGTVTIGSSGEPFTRRDDEIGWR